MSTKIEKVKELIEQYGWPFLLVYWAIFFASVATASTLIALGMNGGEAKIGWDSVIAGYIATKALQPLRILLSVMITGYFVRVED